MAKKSKGVTKAVKRAAKKGGKGAAKALKRAKKAFSIQGGTKRKRHGGGGGH